MSLFLTIPGKAPNLPLKLPRDFTAIGITVVQPQSIGINPKLGINSLPELIAQAKKKPDSISYAVTGVGRLTHLTGELLQIRADIKLQMVPYSGGSAQSLTDVTAGRVKIHRRRDRQVGQGNQVRGHQGAVSPKLFRYGETFRRK